MTPGARLSAAIEVLADIEMRRRPAADALKDWALASRAPLDLRVNTLEGTREQAAEALAHLKPQPTRWSPHGLRIMLSPDARSPAIHAEPPFLKGLVEVQDEGSQIAALCAGAKP